MRRAYIKWIKTVTFAYVYLLNQKTYTNDIISTIKANLHSLFLKKSLIHICLVSPFFFKLNNNLSILMTFAWSLIVMPWPYITLSLKQYASKQKTITWSTAEDWTHVINYVLHYTKARIDSHQQPLTLTDASPPFSKLLSGSLDALKVT
jgi:hypothetical protein